MIDRRSFTPPYRQVADILRAKIADGTYRPGSMLPSETTLSQTYDVSRDTVRKATAELRQEGILEGVGSAGIRVRPEPELSDYSLQRGSRIRVRMPTPEERAEHDIDEGVPVAVVRHGAKTFLLVGDRVELVVK